MITCVMVTGNHVFPLKTEKEEVCILSYKNFKKDGNKRSVV